MISFWLYEDGRKEEMFFEWIGNLGMCRYFFLKKRRGLSVWNSARASVLFIQWSTLSSILVCLYKTYDIVIYLCHSVGHPFWGLEKCPFSTFVESNNTGSCEVGWWCLTKMCPTFSSYLGRKVCFRFPSSKRSFFISRLKLRGSYPSLAELLNKQNRRENENLFL